MRQNHLLPYVVFVSQGGNSERFLNECMRLCAAVTNVKATAYGFEAQVPAKTYLRLHSPARAAGCRLRVVKKCGAWFRLRRLRSHTGAAAGILLALVLLACSGTMIWDIEFYGISAAAQQDLSDRLFACGIYQGALATDEKLRRAENIVMMQTEAYSALALNFTKGKLIVEADPAVKTPTMYLPQDWDICAAQTGIIRSVEVYSGTSDVEAGQLVQKGDVLVRSTWQDQQNKLQPSPCRAKIMAYVEKIYTTVCPRTVVQEIATDTRTDSLAVLLGPVTMWLKKGSNPDAKPSQQGIHVLGLSLPVTVYRTVCMVTQEQDIFYSEEEAKRRCVQALDALIYTELSDVEILSREYEYDITPEQVTATVHLRAYADIAAEPSPAQKNTDAVG